MSGDFQRLYGFQSFSIDYETFTWKIPNVSSMPQTIGYVLKSPSFSFGGSDWILKMYPYGRTAEGSRGYVDVALEKLHYQVEQENAHVKIFYEDIFGKKFFIIDNRWYSSRLQIYPIAMFNSITQSLKDNPEKWRIAPNDTLKLVCALRNKTQENLPTKLNHRNLALRHRTSENDEITEIGEICKEYTGMTHFMIKICDIQLVPAGYEMHLPLSFANTSWILKIYPYFRMENSNKPSFDVVLERLHSEIPEHYVVLQIIMSFPENKIEQSFFFNALHTKGDAINFKFPVGERPCIHFDMNIFMKMIATPESFSQTNKPAEGDNIARGSPVVLQNLKKFYSQKEDCDVIFKVKGQKFPAHRLILKAQSPVLASAFRIDMKEKATGNYDVEDCEPSIFSNFLHFLYCGEVEEKLSKDIVFDLFTVADKYAVLELRAMCMEFIKKNLSFDTFCDTIALAELHSEPELATLCSDFFAKNLKEIIATNKWQSFIKENRILGKKLMNSQKEKM